MHYGKGHHCSRGWNEKLSLKLISKQSYKSERTEIFEVFEQLNESDSDLEVNEGDYNPETDESSDSEKCRYESRSRSNF